MKRYVLGFMFSVDLQRVLLIKKDHPENQKGKLNGIGGKVNEGEFELDGMIREFEEEAGIKTSRNDWSQVEKFGDSTYSVAVYTTFGPIDSHQQMTDELTCIVHVDTLNAFSLVDRVEYLIRQSLTIIRRA